MSEKFSKLTILAFIGADVLPTGIPYSMYTAMFNPETLSVSNQFEYNCDQADGETASEMRYKRIPPREFTFEFLIDGTGASGEKREVELDIKHFKLTTGFLGEIHRPSYLILTWGTFLVRCVLTRMDVKYTLFRPDGTPLRATISATFREYMPAELQKVSNLLSSPDLTHVRTVKAGDRLPLLAYRIYRDPGHYLELARVNDLDNFRTLDPGRKLFFPPVEKSKIAT